MCNTIKYERTTAVECYAVGYREGLLEALRRYAWSKDGEQWVGDGLFTLQQAIERELEVLEVEAKLEIYSYT